MASKQKYYVVWQGLKPGIYTSWDECQAQVKGVAAARYKSYKTMAEAEAAFKAGPPLADSEPELSCETRLDAILAANPDMPRPELNAIATDAACSGNPGVMEYRGVYVCTGTELFHFTHPMGTNNIGEFLGIVHGLAYMKKHNLNLPLYTDSVNAMQWVERKECRTKLPYNDKTADLYNIIHRAEAWLHSNSYNTPILKWRTELWGEIPADFGRKDR